MSFHAGLPFSGGFTGVDIFFAISGFVITRTLVNELVERGRIDLPRFYLRRLMRLLPALAVMLTFVALAGFLFDPAGAVRISGLTGIFASFFSANFYLYSLPNGYFDVSGQLDPLLHTWTLAVEEQFYVLFPVTLLGAWLIGLRGRGPNAARLSAVAAVAAISVVSLALARAWADDRLGAGLSAPDRFGFFGSPARAWEFGAGCILSLLWVYWRRIPVLVGTGFGALGVGLIVLTAVATSEGDPLWATTFVPVAGACALLFAGAAPANGVSRLLARGALAWIGDLSYSWYLWHWPLIVFARALWPGVGWIPAIAALVSLGPAWASYRYVENPIRFSPRFRGRRALALAAVCVAVPVIASAALTQLHHVIAPSYAAAFHADFRRGCDVSLPFGDPTRARCVWPVPAAKGTVVLIGDSNAGQFTEPVVRAGNRAGYTVSVATASSCPFVQLRVASGPTDQCVRFALGSLPPLVRARPSLVVIAARSDAYINQPDVGLALRGRGELTYDPAQKAALWTRGLRAELAALNGAGIPVLVVHPVPVLPVDQNACAVIRVISGGCGASLSRSSIDRQLQPARAAEIAAARGLPLVTALDFENDLCGPKRCSTQRGTRIMYRNENHLSVAGALTFTRTFYREITAHARPLATRGGASAMTT